MEVSNDLKKMLNVYPDKTSLDTNVKYLFSRKEVAGYLLKFLIPEFSDLTVEQAIDYIVETQVSKNEVSENYGDGSFQAKKSTKIQNISTESKVVNEKTIFFDIKFLVKNPKYENGTKNGTIEFVINIEIQNNPKPGYKIEQRGIYYCSRLISEQLGALTENTDYSSLNKVYSLWIVRGAEKDHIKNYRIVDENGNQSKVDTFESNNGFVSFELTDTQNGRVTVQYTGTTLMKISYIVSITTFIGIIIWLVVSKVRKRQ